MRSAAARELQSKDLRRLLGLAHLLGEDDHDDELPSVMLTNIAAVFGCDLVSCDNIDLASRRIISHRHLVAEPEIEAMPGFEHALSQHPGFAPHRRVEPLYGAVALSDLRTPRELGRLALHVDYHRPHGIEDQLIHVVRRDAWHATTLIFNRDRRGFSRRDRAMMHLISRSLKQRVDRHRRRTTTTAIHRHAAALNEAIPRIAELTRCERQVLDRIRTGATNREIARSLTLSERTVEKHVEHLYRKLGVVNRARSRRPQSSLGHANRFRHGYR